MRGVLDSILDTRRKELETLAALYKADAQRKTPGSQDRAEADALTAGTEKSILDLQKQRLDNMLSGVENPIIRAVRSYQLRRDLSLIHI